MFVSAWFAWSAVLLAAEPRVLFVSLDGLGYKNFTQDPAARELRSLHALAKRGFLAPLQTTYPSKTSAGHAALFTGAWSGVNGIFSNTNPRTPRAAYGLRETITGFRSETLAAEPIWTSAARQGVQAVAYQATQMYPFTPLSAGLNEKRPPVVANGYQTWMMAPHRAVRQEDLKEIQPGVYQWTDGPLVLRVERLPGAAGLRVSSAASSVEVKTAPLESGPPRKRPLARRFSPMLTVEANGIRSGVYFRLFELSSTDFLLYRTSAQELGVAGIPFDLQAEGGAFVGNSATSLYERGGFGKVLPEGGDGTAERRYLETLELVVRQLTGQMLLLDRKLSPRLFVGYYPVVDDMEHLWFGLASSGVSAIHPYRAWGYAALDEGLTPLLKRFQNDTVVFSADHGMAGNTHEIRMKALLNELGVAKDTVVPNATCLFVNTVDWKGGLVATSERGNVATAVEAKLSPQGLFTKFYHAEELASRFGLSGPNAPDLCFDVKPGYYPVEGARGPGVAAYPHPRGEHGFDPLRPEMWPYVLVSGGKGIARKNMAPAVPEIKSVDVSPIVSAILGIQPPKDAQGKLPQGVVVPHR